MGHPQFLRLIIAIIGTIFLVWPRSLYGAPLTPDREIVTVEIRYHAPEAGVVVLIWGVDGWQPVPEELWLQGTYKDTVMITPMQQENNTFVAQIRVPAGAHVQYGFSIQETAAGRAVYVWDSGENALLGRLRVQPVLIASQDKILEVEAAINPNPVFVQHTIVYQNQEASDVVLVWGVDGWQVVPEAVWDESTSIKDNLMHTQMVHNGDRFEVTVLVPQGSMMQYGFAGVKIAGSDNGDDFWDGSEDYTFRADSNKTTEINPQNQTPTPSPESEVIDEQQPTMVFLSKNWPLFTLGIVIVLGLFIGFRNTEK